MPEAEATALIADHVLLRLIGMGSYGEVWLGRNTLGACRAIKIVREKTFWHKRPFEREFGGVQKFEPLSRLHEGLVDVLQVGRNDEAGYFYYVMELADDVVSGQAINPDHYTPRTLAHDLARHKRLPVSECRRIGTAMASALHFLHCRGLIHRDVKPSNIVFVHGVPKLADIGLVAEFSEARSYVGTEGFIPPEGPGTVRADVYSLGKVLYEISTGKDRHEYPELPTYLGDSVQEDELFQLHEIVVKACRANPGQRYASAGEMAADLLASSSSQGPRKRIKLWRARAVRAYAGIAAISVVAAVLILSVAKRKPGISSVHSSFGNNPALRRMASPPAGLVAWWKAEGDALDAAGGSAGTAAPGLTFEAGKSGRAFSFDGINGFVSVPGSAALDVGQRDGLTVECWIKPLDLANAYPLVVWLDHTEFVTNHVGVHFWISMGGSASGPGCLCGGFVQPVESGPNHHFWSAGGIVGTNKWQHAALTYDKATGLGRLFLDGAIVAEKHLGTFVPQTSGTLYLGRLPINSYSGVLYRGAMDEVRIYDRALSPAEIRTVAMADTLLHEQPAVIAGPIKNPANGHDYYLLPPTNWPAAEEMAIKLGGHLATINDAAENSWVFETFTRLAGPGRCLWIGLNDAALEGTWVWASGEPVTYLNWSPIEPNSGDGFYPDEDHVAIWSREETRFPLGSWADSPSNTLTCAVVEVVATGSSNQLAAP